MARQAQRKSASEFQEIVEALIGTYSGQEPSMYPHLHRLFVEILGWNRKSVLSDVTGDAGRPDITCKAPSGLILPNGREHQIDWIVLEAKDERCFQNADRREAIFAEKSKYITPNTAWFVMVDPTVFVARPVMSGTYDPAHDLVFTWVGPEGETEFRHMFAELRAEIAGTPEKLIRFREGDTSLIATERLIAPADATKRVLNRVLVARRTFYAVLRETTALLQQATTSTLASVWSDVTALQLRVAEFEQKYGKSDFKAHSLTISARPRSFEETKTYGSDVARLNRRLKRAGSIARLALNGYPQFRQRISADSEDQAQEMFAIETANLILARILLIRFFEDHRFFGEHKYLCNGGVQAFQRLREIFEQGYTRLLKLAYEKAQQLYAAAFDETELDWVFDANDERLSRAIEWAMYQLSRYDFTTVKGDILTGIYDRFLDRRQRKRFGEYYTPPSIARYIVDRLELAPDERFLDPSCGSGTFLIERYQQAVGDEADRGLATFSEVVTVLERLAGNDLNTFSAVLTQIQILWHILSFRDELLAAEEFPDIAVSDKASSILAPETAESLQGRWAELDRFEYGGVGGNPPYVRPERAGEVSPETRAYFAKDYTHPTGKSWPGISAEANLYALFVYKALDHWCRQPNKWGEGAGRLGFVIQLALCGSDENADLRRLLGPNGRWTVKEIVDFEVIWKHIFDVRVLPMILIAEARPPRLPIPQELLDPSKPLPNDGVRRLQVRAARLQGWIDKRHQAAEPAERTKWERIARTNRNRWEPDRVTIRLADKSIIDFHEGGKRPTFRVADSETVTLAYPDIFAPDGRIMTRVTPQRRRIIDKLLENERFPSATQKYWYKARGNGRGAVQLEEPVTDRDAWDVRDMISRGLVWRGTRSSAAPGTWQVYKGENIITGGLTGEPQDDGIDISRASDLGIFRLGELLPERVFAVAMIATCPNAVAIDPRRIAFTDTTTLFGPRSDLITFPFDLLFVSRAYRLFYVIAGRMSFLDMMRSHVYPTNLRALPWNDELAFVAQPLEAVRGPLTEACANAFQTEDAMFAALARLPLRPFRDVVRDSGGRVDWSESFNQAADKIEVSKSPTLGRGDLGWRLQVSDQLYDYLFIGDEEAALGLHSALLARAGELVDKDTLLTLPIAPHAALRADYDATVEIYRGTDHQAAIEAEVDRIDALVGPALGLNTDDLAFIRNDMLTDPFLKNIVPRWPGTSTRLHGYRTGLDSSDRYA